ncbi:MAG: hypothetical protein GY888_18200, partial [Planctomycetaceae bacterium]|nr:hypothetical protein [Planctomycetaceae bacterium]
MIAITVGCSSQQQSDTADSAVQEDKKSVVDAKDSGGVSDTTQKEGPNHGGKLLLNELLASNRTNRRDDTGETSDWLEVYNAGTNTLRLDGYHLTDDLEVPDKWAFPETRMPVGGFYLVWMSGLDRTTLAAEALATSAATIPFQRPLIEAGAEWKYLARTNKGQPAEENQNGPEGWTAIDFNDSDFSVGPAGFGYGDEDDAT